MNFQERSLVAREAAIANRGDLKGFRKALEALPIISLVELETLVTLEDASNHLCYEQSGEEGWAKQVILTWLWNPTLPDGWEDLPVWEAARKIAQLRADNFPEMAAAIEAETERFRSLTIIQ